MARREYKGAAQAAYLTSPLGGATTDLTILCNDLTNWPTGVGSKPFFIVIDRGLASEEKILCESRSGNTITVFNDGITNGRGSDDTTITSHSNNAVVDHVFTATDADEANAHVNDSTTDVHPQYVLESTFDAKGDLLVGTADNTLTRLPVGSDNYVLTADAAESAGVKWSVKTSVPVGSGADQVFWENDQTVTADYTITSGKHAGTFGPVTINSGVTVTVPSGSVWTVV